MAPNTTRTISRKAWDSPVEYPSRESEHGIKESVGNMFNQTFKGNVQGRKHPDRCAFAEPELLGYRKPKPAVQNKIVAIKDLNNWGNYHDEVEIYQGINERNTSWHLTPGGRLNKKDGLTRYGNSHVKDKTS